MAICKRHQHQCHRRLVRKTLVHQVHHSQVSNILNIDAYQWSESKAKKPFYFVFHIANLSGTAGDLPPNKDGSNSERSPPPPMRHIHTHHHVIVTYSLLLLSSF